MNKFVLFILCNVINIRFISTQNDRIFFPGELSLGSSCSASSGIVGSCKLVVDCPQLESMNAEIKLCAPTGGQITICCPEEFGRIRQSHNKKKISAPIIIYDIEDEIEPYCGTPNSPTPWDVSFNFESVDPYHLNDLADRLRNEGFSINVLSTYGDVILNMTYTNETYSKTVGFDIFEKFHAVAGGEDAPPEISRYMALVGQRHSDKINWICDGVVLNREWILTAAHCFLERGVEPNIVRLGDYDWNVEGERPTDFDEPYINTFEAAIANVVVYPEFNVNERYHDIALLKLSKPYPMLHSRINPICLPWGDDTNLDIVDFNVTLSGWGAKEFTGGSSQKTNILQAADLTVFNTSVCQESYSKLLDFRFKWPQGMTPDKTLCVGWEEGGRDACKGDSGAPVAYRGERKQFILAGIVSTGFGCGLAEFPGIYIPINNPDYLSWIKKVAFEGFLDSVDYPDYLVRWWCWRTPFERREDFGPDQGC